MSTEGQDFTRFYKILQDFTNDVLKWFRNYDTAKATRFCTWVINTEK